MNIPKKINSVSGVIEALNGEVYITIDGKRYKIKSNIINIKQ